jgi:hypothetical protein
VLNGYYDTAAERDCLIADFGGTYRCGASSSGLVNTVSFADAACMTPTVTLYGCDEKPLVVEYSLDAETCTNQVTAYEVGAELAG